MAELFHISGDGVHTLRPKPFRDGHREVDLQLWAEANPHLLNGGQPMLSIGTEITTTHGHAIDNLFVDGNGCLVVAELKRGKTPRDVMAQAIDYGAYANQLDWDQVGQIWDARHDGNLETAYRELFGYGFARTTELKHRLLIVAESFEPSIQDATDYLLACGVDLALLMFSYFELDEKRLLDMKVVLGEIPNQLGPKRPPTKQTEDGPADVYRNWVMQNLRERLFVSARERGVEISIGDGVANLNFALEPWPFKLGDCHFQIAVNTRKIGLYFSCRNDKEPTGLIQRLRQAFKEPDNPFDETRLVVARTSTTLSHSTDLPEMSDTNQVEAVIEAALEMVDLIAPIVVASANADIGIQSQN